MEINKIKHFTDLEVWQKAHTLAVETYKATRIFPKEEIFSLVNQIRRAVISIGSNIAEGFSRNGSREKIQFYSIAKGSLSEVQNQLLVSKDIGYLPIDAFEKLFSLSTDIHKMLNRLSKSINEKSLA